MRLRLCELVKPALQKIGATGASLFTEDASEPGPGPEPEPSSAFVSTWNTTNTASGSSASNQVTLPLASDGVYDFTVDWGDGNQDAITAFDQAEATHTYAVAGQYEITITGTITGWAFMGSGDRLKLLDVSQWGPFNPGSSFPFYLCSNLDVSATDCMDTTGVTNMAHMFRDCSSLTAINVSEFDTSLVTTMEYMFSGCSSLQSLNLLSFNTANVVGTLQKMFDGCISLTSLDLSSFNTSGVTGLQFTFQNCQSLTSIDVSSFNTANVGQFWGTFNGCALLTHIDADVFDLSSVTLMGGIFAGVTLNTANYDSILIAYEAQAVPNSIVFGAGNSKYTPGGVAEAARSALISDHAWQITDGGPTV